MNKCPNCGAELPEGSKFCFYCMSTLNPRQTISMPQAKIVSVPAIAASALCAAAVITGAVIFAHNTLGKSLPKASVPDNKKMTAIVPSDTEYSSDVDEIVDSSSYYNSDTSSAAETSAASESSSSAEESDSEAVTETTTVTTTTTAAPEPVIAETPDYNYENEERYENQQDYEDETTEYLSTEGSTGLSNALCDFVNPMREKYGANLLHASGQLDRACQKAADALSENHLDQEINPLPYFEEVGLSLDHEVQFVIVWCFWRNEKGKDDKEVFINWVKRDFMTVGSYPDDFEWLDYVNINQTNLSYGIKDYNYLSVVCRRDPAGDNFAPNIGKTGECLAYWIVAMK